MDPKDADAVTHLANCPVARNEPGACLGCNDVPDEVYSSGRHKGRKKKKKSLYELAQNAQYMRDRRQRPKRIAGEEFRYDSVDHLPPIELDANGYAKKPPTPGDAWNYNFTVEQRKVRFLLYWNYAGGNWTVACQFAGVSRAIADKWLEEDARIAPLMARARKEISDRMRFRLMQVAGLVLIPKPISINTTALLGLVREYGIVLAPDGPVEEPPMPAPPTPAAPGAPVGGIPRPGQAAPAELGL